MLSSRALAFAALSTLAAGCAAPPAPPPSAAAGPEVTPIALPAGAPGIGFDDLQFSAKHGVMAPAGRSGLLDLVDPATQRVSSIGGFTVEEKYDGGHDTGITSVDEGAGFLFVVDRSNKKLSVIDPDKRAAVASAALAEGPDYVRWVAPTKELWVTEPDAEQIEVFSLDTSAAPRLTKAATIKVPKGPESLVVDAARGRAYANSWKRETFALDLRARAVVATWPNACQKSRGLAFDGDHMVFVGCAEGGAVALDVTSGRELGAAPSGDGVDIIAYSPSRRHLYVPGGKARTLTIMAVSANGWLTPLGTVPTAPKAHCATTDDRGTVYVCDPDHGQLLAIRDPYVPSR
jgi:DNA-binding beta-propeller fold protein YncE